MAVQGASLQCLVQGQECCRLCFPMTGLLRRHHDHLPVVKLMAPALLRFRPGQKFVYGHKTVWEKLHISNIHEPVWKRQLLLG